MRCHAILLGLTLLGLALPVGAGSAEEAEPEPAIDPQARELVQRMSNALAQLEHFDLLVADTIDDVLDTGQKIQYTHIRSATVSRPDKLKIEVKGDITNRVWWKDGKTVTMLDTANNVYGQIDDPGTIEQLVDLLSERYGVQSPLADLFSPDLEEIMADGMQTGEYLGIHLAGRTECHHLAFTDENIDWQVWIDTGEKALPRKLLITYKQLPGQPQYTAMVERIEELSEVADDVFAFEPPEGAEKVKVQPVESPEDSDSPQGE